MYVHMFTFMHAGCMPVRCLTLIHIYSCLLEALDNKMCVGRLMCVCVCARARKHACMFACLNIRRKQRAYRKPNRLTQRGTETDTNGSSSRSVGDQKSSQAIHARHSE